MKIRMWNTVAPITLPKQSQRIWIPRARADPTSKQCCMIEACVIVCCNLQMLSSCWAALFPVASDYWLACPIKLWPQIQVDLVEHFSSRSQSIVSWWYCGCAAVVMGPCGLETDQHKGCPRTGPDLWQHARLESSLDWWQDQLLLLYCTLLTKDKRLMNHIRSGSCTIVAAYWFLPKGYSLPTNQLAVVLCWGPHQIALLLIWQTTYLRVFSSINLCKKSRIFWYLIRCCRCWWRPAIFPDADSCYLFRILLALIWSMNYLVVASSWILLTNLMQEVQRQDQRASKIRK